jgi:DNA-damage-inducible protein J
MNLRIEPEIKANAEELFGSFGLTVTDAVNVFLRQSLMRGGFLFEIVCYKPN